MFTCLPDHNARNQERWLGTDYTETDKVNGVCDWTKLQSALFLIAAKVQRSLFDHN